jgi:hypothetical protein
MMVVNPDGTIEVRKAMPGEKIAGFIADGIGVTPKPPLFKPAASKPPAGVETFEPPTFAELGKLRGNDARLLQRFVSWSAARPKPPVAGALEYWLDHSLFPWSDTVPPRPALQGKCVGASGAWHRQ